MTISTDNIKQCLSLCTWDDKLRPWMATPFSIGGYNGATNAHVLIAFKGDLLFQPCAASEASKTAFLGFVDGSKLVDNEGAISAMQIRRAMKKWPRTNECPECDGLGWVEEDVDCPACKGKGQISKATTPSTKEYLNVDGVGLFLPAVWEKLTGVTRILSVSEWTITHGSSNNGMRLISRQGKVVMLLMPAQNISNVPPFHTIHKHQP